MFEAPEIKSHRHRTKKDPRDGKISADTLSQNIRGKKNDQKSGRPNQVALNKTPVSRQSEDGRQHELRQRRNARIQCERQSARKDRAGSRQTASARASWGTGSARRERCLQAPMSTKRAPASIETHDEPQKTSRNNPFFGDFRGNLNRAEIEFAEEEKDWGSKVVEGAEAACIGLDGLDARVQTFGGRAGSR